MDGQGLEWSHCLKGGPRSWSLIECQSAAFTTETAPRLHLLLFDTDLTIRRLCGFVQWHPEDAQVAVFQAEELDNDPQISCAAETFYVREVPSPLVVTCSLTPVPRHKVDVVFTTIAGEEMLRIADISNFSPELGQLAKTAAVEAAIQGRLQSHNQAVCTALDEQMMTVILSDDWWDAIRAEDT